MDDSRLLQESNFSCKALGRHIMSYRQLRVKDYMVARGGIGPTIFCSEGTDHHHSTNHDPKRQTNADSLTKLMWKSVSPSDCPFIRDVPGSIFYRIPDIWAVFYWVRVLDTGYLTN